MKNNQILTCHQCPHYLQDKDLAEIRTLTPEEIQVIQEYQNRKVLESYYNLFGNEDNTPINPTVSSNSRRTVTTSNDETARRKCELCSQHWSYDDIFLLHCNCKICYDCFAKEMHRQRDTTNELLGQFLFESIEILLPLFVSFSMSILR